MAIWMLVVGAALLGLVAYDSAVTTISVATGAGPLTGRIGDGWWKVAHRLARRPTSPVITSAGPLILVMTAMAWLVLLWAGWTLIFAADASAVVSSTTQQPADWWSRVYYAGFTMFTLGVGDYVPQGAPWQLLTVVATVSGLALTTVAVTYLVPLVTAATQRAKQANSIAGLGGDAHDIVIKAYADGSVSFLGQVVMQLLDGLLLTAQRHVSYPILHYFHPRTAAADLRIQLAALDDALIMVRYGLADRVERPHGAVIDAGRYAIVQLLEHARTREPRSPVALSLEPLRRAGIATVDDATFARRLDEFAEDRARMAAYTAESMWIRPTSAS